MMSDVFWLLEDVRCRRWSGSPLYLDAGFYSKTSMNSPFTTIDRDCAMKFLTWEAAERFMADKDLVEHFKAVEHEWIGAATLAKSIGGGHG
jgi:hypothetical protein